MRILGVSFVSLYLLNCIYGASFAVLSVGPTSSTAFDIATLPDQKGPVVGRRQSRIITPDEGIHNHIYEEYPTSDDTSTLLTKNPLDITKTARRSSLDSSANSGPNADNSRIYAPFPAVKPIPPFGSDGNDEHQATYLEGSVDSSRHLEDDSIDATDLMSLIPTKFEVTEDSGNYQFYEEKTFLTSSEIMKKRYALYLLLSEVYTLFDFFAFSGFSEFLGNTPAVKTHQDFRYHLIENLAQRSLKTTNIETCESLGRFITMIDDNSAAKTVGKSQHDTFEEFEKRLKGLEKKSNQFSEQINEVISCYLANEKKRLKPLDESIKSGDYDVAIQIIEQSRKNIYVSFADFLLILDQPCSSVRYLFLSWAIGNGHFDAHERFGEQTLTPLMIAAKCPRWSNDVIKAILWKAPSTVSEVDSKGSTALSFANSNQEIHKKYRKPMIEMLSLVAPTNDSLNEIVLEYIKKKY